LYTVVCTRYITAAMEYKEPNSKRRTKKDKAKEHNERNGGKSTKHVRIVTGLVEKRGNRTHSNK